MGTLGLYDEDSERYIHTVFNLEIMKFAAYYKKRREIVTLAPSFCPEKYTNFIYRKDYNDGIFPTNLIAIPNLRFGGLAFANNHYIPQDIDIEMTPPDPSIYDSVKNRFSCSAEKEDIFHSMRVGAHIRLSLDGKKVWNQFNRQLHNLNQKSTLFIHDYSLGYIEDDYYVVKDILTHMKQYPQEARIAAKFPINITSNEQMIKWASLPSAAQFFTLCYDGVFPDDVLYELIQSGYGFDKKLEYNITKSCYNEQVFFEQILPQIFRHIIFSRSYRIKILLKYDEDFFKAQGWDKIINLFNSYMVSLYDSVSPEHFQKIIKDDSLYSFVKNLPEKATLKSYPTDRARAREVFNLMREKNYDLFTDFYECHQVEYKGGKFVNA